MEKIFLIASIWLFLSVISAIISYHLKMSVALVEICIGIIVGSIANHYFGQNSLGSNFEWLKFLAASGSIFLTFLVGAELDHKIIKTKLKEVIFVGIVGFLFPFLGCSVIVYYFLHWNLKASLLTGVAFFSFYNKNINLHCSDGNCYEYIPFFN